jgi:hypothetical protein
MVQVIWATCLRTPLTRALSVRSKIYADSRKWKSGDVECPVAKKRFVRRGMSPSGVRRVSWEVRRELTVYAGAATVGGGNGAFTRSNRYHDSGCARLLLRSPTWSAASLHSLMAVTFVSVVLKFLSTVPESWGDCGGRQ